MFYATRRAMIGAAVLTTLALGLSACTSDPSEDSNQDEGAGPEQVVLASFNDLAADSYTLETSMTVNGVDFLQSTSVHDGESSMVSQDMYMSALLDAAGDDYSDDLAEDPDMAEMMETLFADSHTETVLVEGVVYMQFSGGIMAASDEFGEDAWFTVDLAEAGDLSDVYEQVGSFDLASQTETLLNDLADLEETGDGVYTGSLAGDSELLQSMVGATSAATDPTVEAAFEAAEVTVTLDDAGLFKTFEMTLPEIDGITIHSVTEVVEIGGDYDITVPDTDNIHSLEEFATGMQ